MIDSAGAVQESLPAEGTYGEEPTMAHDQLLDHEYDGIQEYDNPCPGWWHAIFWLTVLFSVVVLPLLSRRQQRLDAGRVLEHRRGRGRKAAVRRDGRT